MGAVLAALLSFLSACGDNATESSGGRVQAVASFYPLAEAAGRVGGEHATVTDLTPAGSEPHDLELAPAQVDAVEDADVVFYLGGGFQPSVERAARRTQGRAVDLLRAVDHRPDDPHVWLDPARMRVIVEHMRDVYVDVDPPSATAYRSNAETYAAELDDLDRAFREGLAECERREIVTSHDAFGYLATRYDLTQHAVSGLSPESEPDPGRISELADLVRSRGVTTVFYESLVSPRVAETLAREANVRTAVLNPLEGLTREQARRSETYLSVMRDNLQALRTALGCR